MAEVQAKFGISSYLQDIVCQLGQSQVFEDGESLLSELLGIHISARQIQRVSEFYGEELEKQLAKEITDKAEAKSPVKAQGDIYVMADGSMVYTREEGWKELKLGRIFAAVDHVKIQEKRSAITKSLYVAHLGEHGAFTRKMEAYMDHYKNKICIADGAKWIWNWIENTYPEAVQILDYYHAVEKLSPFALAQWDCPEARKKWTKEQQEKLLNNQVADVMLTIERTITRNKDGQQAKEAVLRYYEQNQSRMQYKTYKDKGLLIGSGPMEAAHRNVVQQRLKLSGQRWTIKGAQYIVNLRATKKSYQWEKVNQLIKKAA
jgi:uncharacterized protein YcfL